MNSIRLFLKLIKSSLFDKPLIYIVLLFFYIFCININIYVIAKYSSNLLAYDDYDDSLSTFSIDYRLSSDTKVGDIIDNINEYINSDNVEFISLRFLDCIISEDQNSDNQKIPHYAICYAKNENFYISKYLSNINIDQINIQNFINGINEAVVVLDASNMDCEDNYVIQGNDFVIIDRVPRGKNEAIHHLISFKSAIYNNLIIREIKIKYKTINGYNDMNEIKNKLNMTFSKAVINEPVLRDYNAESIFSFNNILVYMILILSASNYIYMYKYIVKSRKKQYSIYSIYGCSKFKLTIYLAAEIFIIAMLGSFIGITIFCFVTKQIIINMEPLLKYSFNEKLYLIVVLITLTISFASLFLESLVFYKRRSV